MEVRYHPLFERWLTALSQGDEDIFGEVMALLTALEVHGRELDDETREESHPVVTSRFDMHALRRTPSSYSAATRQLSATTGIQRSLSRLSTDSNSSVSNTPA